MLKHTFCHIRGISTKAEQQLWSAGLHHWELQHRLHELSLSPRRRERLGEGIAQSLSRLAAEDIRYFADLLPPREHWRLLPYFRHRIAYLDIETTGLGGPSDIITSIALYDGQQIHTYVHGQNLQEFVHDIRRYDLIVTYNGKCFDFPFIRSVMHLPMDQVHIDLRYLLASLGHKGGLKGCEKQLGMDRGELEGVDGFFAVLLWREYEDHGDRHALETLLAYNIEDVVNLEQLLVIAYNLKLQQTPFAGQLQLPRPAMPVLPYEPHGPTIQRLKQRYMGFSAWG